MTSETPRASARIRYDVNGTTHHTEVEADRVTSAQTWRGGRAMVTYTKDGRRRALFIRRYHTIDVDYGPEEAHDG